MVPIMRAPLSSCKQLAKGPSPKTTALKVMVSAYKFNGISIQTMSLYVIAFTPAKDD